jgi:hypothetical protein
VQLQQEAAEDRDFRLDYPVGQDRVEHQPQGHRHQEHTERTILLPDREQQEHPHHQEGKESHELECTEEGDVPGAVPTQANHQHMEDEAGPQHPGGQQQFRVRVPPPAQQKLAPGSSVGASGQAEQQ